MNKFSGCNDEQKELLIKAIQYDDQNNIEKAKELYLKILSLNNEIPYVNAMLGGIEFDKKNYNEAIKFFNKAIELYPEAASTLELRAEAKENLGFLKEALCDYENVVKLKPEYSKAYFNQGLIYEYKHDYKKALKFYKKAVYFNPNNHIYIKKIIDFKKYIKYLKSIKKI